MVMWKEEQPLEVFCKKGVFKNFAKVTGKHLCQSLFFNKVAGLAKFLRTPFLTEHLRATASKVWKECRINFRFFQTDISEQSSVSNAKSFISIPEILFVFKLAWHWLADSFVTAAYTTSCCRIDVLWRCNDVVCALCRRYFLKVVPNFEKRSAR